MRMRDICLQFAHELESSIIGYYTIHILLYYIQGSFPKKRSMGTKQWRLQD